MPTFETTEALVTWMEDVYLSELVLLKKPTKKGFVVGMPDLDHEGAKDRFFVWSFAPKGVSTWQLSGELGTDCELTFDRAPEVKAPVALRLHAGGTLVVGCASIEVKDEPPKLRKARPRAWQNSFTMWSDDTTTTVGQLLGLLGLPSLRSFGEPSTIALPDWTLAELRDRSHRAWCAVDGERWAISVGPVFRHEPGWTLGIQRRETATDDEWDRAWKLPTLLPTLDIRSRTLHTDAAGWAKLDWRRAVPSKRYG